MSDMSKVKRTIKTKCPTCKKSDIETINPLWLRLVRLHVGYSLREISKNTGFSHAFIADIEKGKRKANQTIINFYDYLNER